MLTATLTSIVSFAFVLGVLVVVHEAGHFAMAKRIGVRAIRFSVGYPPKIWGIRRGETEYSIGAIPFGGYVRMLGNEIGEDPKSEVPVEDSELSLYLHEIGHDLIGAAREHGTIAADIGYEPGLHAIAERLGAGASGANEEARAALGRELHVDEAILLNEIRDAGGVEAAIKHLAGKPPRALTEAYDRRAFPTQPLGRRALVILAGPMANLLFAPILLTAVYMLGVPRPLPVVGKLDEKLPAYAAGVRAGDTILSIDGQPVKYWDDVSRTIKQGDGSPLKLEIDRKQNNADQHLTIIVQPAKRELKTLVGKKLTWVIGIMASESAEITERYGPIGAMKEAVTTSADMTVQFVESIGTIITGQVPVRDALGGPIMIAQMAGKEVHQGYADFALFMVMLSLELGIINLLPVPLLDGGHLLFFAFEGVRGKPLALRSREMILQVGLFLLVALMAFVIFNDISRIVQG